MRADIAWGISLLVGKEWDISHQIKHPSWRDFSHQRINPSWNVCPHTMYSIWWWRFSIELILYYNLALWNRMVIPGLWPVIFLCDMSCSRVTCHVPMSGCDLTCDVPLSGHTFTSHEHTWPVSSPCQSILQVTWLWPTKWQWWWNSFLLLARLMITQGVSLFPLYLSHPWTHRGTCSNINTITQIMNDDIEDTQKKIWICLGIFSIKGGVGGGPGMEKIICFGIFWITPFWQDGMGDTPESDGRSE